MKKNILKGILALVLAVSCIGTLAACTMGTVKAPEIPEGYQTYDNGAISFAISGYDVRRISSRCST